MLTGIYENTFIKVIAALTLLSVLIGADAFDAPLRGCLDKIGKLVATQRCGRGQIPVT